MRFSDFLLVSDPTDLNFVVGYTEEQNIRINVLDLFAGQIIGSGTPGYLPVFTSSQAIGDSVVFQHGPNIVIGGVDSLGYRFAVSGSLYASNGAVINSTVSGADALRVIGADGDIFVIPNDLGQSISSLRRIIHPPAILSTESATLGQLNAAISNLDGEIDILLALKVDKSSVGAVNGVASLDSGGKVPLSQIPDSIIGQVEYMGTWNAFTNTPTLNPLVPEEKGHYYVVSAAGVFGGIDYEVGDWIISNGLIWEKVDNTDAVTSVFGRIGAILALEGDYQSFYPRLSQAYDNPSFINSLAYSKITGVPPFLLENQTITLSGDVTGTGKTSITSTISNNVVSNEKLRDSLGTSVIGRAASSTGDPGDIQASTDGHVLLRSAGNLLFGLISSDSISSIDWSKITNTPTTLLGYGITNAYTKTESDNKFVPYNSATTDVNLNTHNITANSFIKQGGTSAQFLKGDGSIDLNQYVPTTRSINSGAGLTGGGNLSSDVTLAFDTAYGDNRYAYRTRQLTINGTTFDLSADRIWSVGTVTSVGLSAPTGFSVSGTPVTLSGTLALAFAAGYSLPTNASQATWDTAYNNSIVSAAVTGIETKLLTLTQQDGGTITASWSDFDTAPVTSVFGRLGAIVALSGDYNTSQVTENVNLYFTNDRARSSISLTTAGVNGPATYNSTTGVFNIPNYTTDISGLVPYTGANQTVNLNTQQLQAGHATFTTNGSTDTLTVNHTSGSGKGISVTKSGSGEGLTVVKSSGSGNAASITGGITLLSQLNLTTALADLYIASATNWNTAYNNRITSLTNVGTSGSATLVNHVLNIPIYQAQGNYITSLIGEATASGPGAATITLTNSAVTGKVLTGLTVSGSSVVSTDSILTAFGKLQGQVNDLLGGLKYDGTWNAATNTPTITSGVGTDGEFYIVSVAGNTTIDGISGWEIGDWIVFHGTAWQKVDNTESVVSVNGLTGAVTLTTSNITEGTNQYFTNARARAAVSLTTTGNSGASTYNSGTGVFNIPQYTLTGLGGVPLTRSLTINGVNFDLSSDRSYTVGDVRTDSSYSNPAFIASLAWGKITGTPTTLGGYGISDAYTQTQVNNLLAGYVTLGTDQTITGLKTIVRSGDVLNFKIGTDTLYGLKVAYNQNELVPSGEATWSFVNTFNRDGSGFSVTPLSFFRGVLVTGERLLSASINANLLDYYGNNPSGRYPVYAYNTGVQQFSTGIIVGKTTGVVNAANGSIADLPSGVVANFNGRVIGQSAANSNEFVTLSQLGGYVPTSRTLTINGITFDLSENRSWTIAAGVSSFNTRTGAITLLSADVTGALGYTPYNASNPAGYTSNLGTVTSVSGTGTVSGLTLSGTVTSSGSLTLGGTLTLTSANVTSALGYTPVQPNGTGASGTWGINITGNAETVDGFSASQSTVANAIVVRDSSGYIFGNYIHMSDDGNPGAGTAITSFITKQGDNYYRSVSPTNAMSSIRGVASGTWPINIAGSAGSAGSASTASLVNGTSGGAIQSWDIRTISPSSMTAARLGFGFTSWANNNGAPYADYLHLRSYPDGSGGSDNLVMFLKSGIGMRIYQQTFGSASAYSSFADVLLSTNFNSYALPLTGGTLTGPVSLSNAAYFTGSPSSGFRFNNSADTINALIVNNSGDSIAHASMRAPIFFDSNDTGYYADFNSTADNAIRVRGGALHGPNLTWGAYLLVGGDGRNNYTNTSFASVCTTNGNLHLDAGSGYETYINFYDGGIVNFGNGSNSVVSSINPDGSHRPQIIYDYNNTGFYFDPSGTSNINSLVLNNTLIVAASNAQFWQTANGAYQRVDSRNEGNAARSHWYGVLSDGSTSNFRHSWYDGSAYFNITATGGFINFTRPGGGSITTDGSFRAPIFFDSNDTAYFIDPASDARLRALVVGYNTESSPGIFRVAAGHGDTSIRLTAQGLGSGNSPTMQWWVSEPNITWDDGGFGYNVTNDGGSPGGFGRVNTSWGQAYMRMSTDGSWRFYNTNTSGTRTQSLFLGPTGAALFGSTIQTGSVWINNGANFNAYDENIRLFNASNGVSVIAFSATGLSGMPTTSILGYSDRMEFRYGNGAQFRIFDGFTTSMGSSRAPIFFDSDNTGFYFDGAGTTNINFLSGNGKEVMQTSDSYLRINQSSTFSGGTWFGSTLIRQDGFYAGSNGGTTTSRVAIQSGGFNGTNVIDINGSNGIITVAGDVRAPIFYDSNNTQYFVDANNNTELRRLGLRGGVTGSVFNELVIQRTQSGSATGIAQGTNIEFFNVGSNVAFCLQNTNDAMRLFYYDGSVFTWFDRFRMLGNGGLANVSGNNVNLSDVRLKTDINPVSSYWDVFKNIDIVKFKYKDQTNLKEHIGVVAQELEKIAPEFVSSSEWDVEQGIKTVFTSDLHHATIAVLKEALLRIEQLENKLS